MRPYWQQDGCTIYHDDCRDVMWQMPGNHVDTIITDPPYGLEFMGHDWDHGVPGMPFWRRALDVAKPGAILLAFGGTRTWHRLACAIEDAGWEYRDTLCYMYGSGFPKGHRFSEKAGDKWEGWNVNLKPAWEPILLCQAPLDGTYAENAQKHGVAGLNIDGCRIATNGIRTVKSAKSGTSQCYGEYEEWDGEYSQTTQGRWPANVVLDPQSAEMLDEQSGMSSSSPRTPSDEHHTGRSTDFERGSETSPYSDTGGASRFFYTAKASRAEREAGCGVNQHPTVKPLDLLRWLVRLTKPPTGGTVLDPFMGSGTTGMACVLEGRDFIGIEQHDIEDKPYCTVAKKRIQWVQRCGEDFVEADKQEREKQESDQSHLF